MIFAKDIQTRIDAMHGDGDSATDEIVSAVGRHMNHADDWIAVALACIDQAMVPVAVQDRIAKILDAVQS